MEREQERPGFGLELSTRVSWTELRERGEEYERRDRRRENKNVTTIWYVYDAYDAEGNRSTAFRVARVVVGGF
jgi:hypothetical protein